MTNSDRKIRPIYGHTLRQLIETKNPDISYMYLYLMFTEDESHTVSLEKLKSPYGGIEWETKRIDRAIEELIAMNLVAYGFDEDLETGEMIENRNELFLSEMVDTQSEVIARMNKWVFDADIHGDAERQEREDYDDESCTFDEKRAIDADNKELYEELKLRTGKNSFFMFDFDIHSSLVSFVPVDDVSYGNLIRNADNTWFIKAGECDDSIPVRLIRRFIPLSDNDTVLAVYEWSKETYGNSLYSHTKYLETPDGKYISDAQCRYVVGVDKETARRLSNIDTERNGDTYYVQGFIND